MAKYNKPTSRQRDLIVEYRTSHLTKPEVMKKLKLGRDYHMFNAIFHNCTMEEDKE